MSSFLPLAVTTNEVAPRVGQGVRPAPGTVAVQRVIKVRRDYSSWVARETMEDHALRFTPRSFRKWSALRVAHSDHLHDRPHRNRACRRSVPGRRCGPRDQADPRARGAGAHGRAHAQCARNALDAFGHATMAIHSVEGSADPVRSVWQTPPARQLLLAYFAATPGQIPAPVLNWLDSKTKAAAEGREPRTLPVSRGARQLVFSLQQRTGDDDLLIVMREVSDAAVVAAMVQSFKLTLREAEVLYWVAKAATCNL